MPQQLKQDRHRLSRIGVVFDQQNPHASRIHITARRMHYALANGIYRERQCHNEFSAFSIAVTMRLDPPAVQLDQASRYRKTNTQPTLRSVKRTIRLCEQIPNPRQKLWTDSYAIVTGTVTVALARCVLSLIRPPLSVYFPALVRRFTKYLLKSCWIGVKEYLLRRDRGLECDTASHDKRLCALDGSANNFPRGTRSLRSEIRPC